MAYAKRTSTAGNPQDNRRFLWLPAEPTPYILALARILGKRSPWRIQLLFMAENRTQPWHLKLDPAWNRVLPANRLTAMKQILAELRTGDLAGVMLAGWHGILPVATLIACRLLGIPTCLTSDTQVKPRQALWKYLAKALWYPLLFRLPNLFFVAGTRQVAMVRRYGVRDARIRVFGLTVDVATIRDRIRRLRPQRKSLRARFGLEAEATVALYVGRLEDYKGIGDLLTGFQATAPRYPTARLLVAGSGPMGAAVTQAAERDPRIRFPGRLDFDGVVEALTLADLAIVPSRVEPWGLVVIEALAAGLPVIATHCVGCVDDLIRDGNNGLIVPDRDPTALHRALESLLGDPERLQRMQCQSDAGIGEWTMERSAEKIVAGWQAMDARRKNES